jgi:hypothetical protein
MCSISGSFHPGQLWTLYERQLDRGAVTHSLSAYNIEKRTLEILEKGLGNLDIETVKELPYDNQTFYIVHSQAPTGASTDAINIHPAEEQYIFGRTSYLWHNGIIKAAEVERLNKEYSTNLTWDTKLLLHLIVKKEDLSQVDGQFACVFVDPDTRMHIFRNELAPLYLDKDMNIASKEFEGAVEVPDGTIWWVDFPHKSLVPVDRFTTKICPYYFIE